MRLFLLIAILSTLSCFPSFGQEPLSEVLKQYLAAAKSQKLADVARFYHPDGLKQFRKVLRYFDTRSDSPWGEQVRKGFFGPDASQASVSKLSDVEFFASYFTRSIETVRTLLPGLSDGPDDLRFVGAVPEGADTQHVVYYASATVEKDRKATFINVTTFKRAPDGSWKLAMPDTLLWSVEAIARRINEG